MEDFRVLKTLSAYKEDLVEPNTSNFKKEKEKDTVNKIEYANFTNIVLTNEKYKARMNRSKKDNKFETFTNKSEFNDFIEQDIVNMKKYFQWKRLPKSWQSSMCEEYIINDETIDDVQRLKLLKKLDHLIPHVEYNKSEGIIKNINYDAIDGIEVVQLSTSI